MHHHAQRYDDSLYESSLSGRTERIGARGQQRIIRHAVEAELGAFSEEHSGERDARGRRALGRNSYLPSREVLTGSGPVFPLGAVAAVFEDGVPAHHGPSLHRSSDSQFDVVRRLEGPPEGHARSQGRSAGPKRSRPRRLGSMSSKPAGGSATRRWPPLGGAPGNTSCRYSPFRWPSGR